MEGAAAGASKRGKRVSSPGPDHLRLPLPPSLDLRPAHRRGPSNCAPYRFYFSTAAFVAVVAVKRRKGRGRGVFFPVSAAAAADGKIQSSLLFLSKTKRPRIVVHVILSRHSVVLTRAVSPALAGGAGANVLNVTNEYVKWIQFVTGKKKKKKRRRRRRPRSKNGDFDNASRRVEAFSRKSNDVKLTSSIRRNCSGKITSIKSLDSRENRRLRFRLMPSSPSFFSFFDGGWQEWDSLLPHFFFGPLRNFQERGGRKKKANDSVFVFLLRMAGQQSMSRFIAATAGVPKNPPSELD